MRKLSLLLAFVLMLSAFVPAFAQEAPAQEAPTGLTGLRVRDAAQTGVLSAEFNPEQSRYFMYTQSDTYGVEFTPTGADVVINGVEVADGQAFVYDLPQTQETLYDPYYGEVEVVAGDKTYTYVIVREDPGYITTDVFELKTWEVEGGEMYYWLYVPENYDASREYPVVLYLHGSGQRKQPADMVLLRNQAAGSFVKYGYEAIVIAPQCNYTDLSDGSTGWRVNNEDGTMSLSKFGQGAYDILQNVKGEYNIDASREYVTGLSMGGMGSSAMISAYPEEFAAAIINCGYASNHDQFINAVKAGGTKFMLVHSTGDESVNFTQFQSITASLNKADLSYKTVVYGPDDFLYPMRHFSWQPAYANKDNLDWLFNQSRDDGENVLVDLRMEESTQKLDIAFNQATTEYEVTVQSDIYGIRFTPYGKGSFTVNDTPVKGGEGYVLELSQDPADYTKEMVYEVKVADANKTYTVKIIREDGSYHYDAFTLNTHKLADGKEMNYWLHLPENYDASKKYPVVLALHGSGQRTQEPTMILKRSIQANAFVKMGYEAIIIAPQCNYTDLPKENLISWCDGNSEPDTFAVGAYDILQQIKAEYSVDANRVYITGLSNGGRGTQGMIAAYPEEFAAALIIAAGQEPTQEQWQTVIDANIPLWFAVHVKDGLANPNAAPAPAAGGQPIGVSADGPAACTIYNTNTLTKLGKDFNLTVYPENTFLSTSSHFCWIPTYANTAILDWMFAQSK